MSRYECIEALRLRNTEMLGARPLAVRDEGSATREKTRSIGLGRAIDDYVFDRTGAQLLQGLQLHEAKRSYLVISTKIGGIDLRFFLHYYISV